MTEWKVLDTGVQTAEENMRLDGELLDTLDPDGPALLHLYDWKGESATYGYFVKPADFLNLEAVEERGITLARRPTGGGIVFHIWDLAFSLLVPFHHRNFSPNTLENYAFVNDRVKQAMSTLIDEKALPELIEKDAAALDPSCTRFCMAQPTKYDVVWKGKKIAGAAQRKTKRGFLHQGTISLKLPPFEELRELLLPGTQVLEAMVANTYPCLPDQIDLCEGRALVKQLLIDHFTREKAHV